MTFPSIDLIALLPEIILVAGALGVLLLDLVIKEKRILGWLSLVAVVAALAAMAVLRPAAPVVQGMALADSLGRFAGQAILAAAALAILLSVERVATFTKRPAPYYSLVLLATTGMTVLAIASDFMTIFLGFEILSVALYVLVGFYRGDLYSGEAALKYFLLGAFASGFLLYGVALIYAGTGTTSLEGLERAILPSAASLPFAPLLPLGVGLLLVGFGFKIALVPFHMWTPDVYQGAPTPVTAFMSVATKMAAFAALIRVLAALPTVEQPWRLALAALSVLTMTWGNLAALRQTSLKRMLAYSSIAQAGYIIIGLAAGNEQGAQGALYYLLAYTFMNLGAFATVQAIQQANRNDVTREDIVGLAGRQPAIAAIMAVFMFGLAGIPPLAGFFGKLYVFRGAVDANLTWLAIVGVINSAIAAYYYLRVTVEMYMAERAPAVGGAAAPRPTRVTGSHGPEADLRPAPEPHIPWPVWATLIITAAGTIVLGLWQYPWMQNINQAVLALVVR